MASLRTLRTLETSSDGHVQPGVVGDVVRTMCGREFTVGELHLERAGQPTARVWLSTHPLPQDGETLWASLTAHEARQLAAHLLRHAAATDTPAAAAPESESVEVDYVGPRSYTVRLGGGQLFLAALDDPARKDPVADLVAAAVALELAGRAERFLARHETRREGLRVRARVRRARPGQRRTLAVSLATAPSLSRERRNALRTLLSRNVLRDPPCPRQEIEITVD